MIGSRSTVWQVINKYLHDHELGSIDIDERRKSIEGSYSAEKMLGRFTRDPQPSQTRNLDTLGTSPM